MSWGEHRGYWFHTIGQRKGLGLSQGPWYVVGKDVEDNRVLVSHREHFEERARDRLLVGEAHWINGAPEKCELGAKLRHSEHVFGCRVEASADGRWEVQLDAKDPGVAPGQFAVFYDGEECLGGARIL